MAQTQEKITYTATPEQIERMHALFRLPRWRKPNGMLGKTYPMIINGQDRTSAKTFDVTSPIDRVSCSANSRRERPRMSMTQSPRPRLPIPAGPRGHIGSAWPSFAAPPN